MQQNAFSNPVPLRWGKTWRIMKLLAIFLFAAALHASATGHAQKVNLKFERISLKQVLDEIKEQTGYSYFGNQQLFERTPLLRIDLENLSVKEALDACLKDLPVTYEIQDKIIYLEEKKDKANLNDNNAPPPATIEVKGRVFDSTGAPLVGAQILVKGTKVGVTTDEGGEFTIKAAGDATLVVSFIGYGTQEEAINNRTNIRFALKVTDKQLADYTVRSFSNGYQSIPKERAAGSFAQPDKIMFDGRVTTNVLDKLNGITSGAGVIKRSTAGDGNPIGIQIRGISTINGDPTPLIIVDNFPYDGNINNINPNDVVSITILKDAAASSIWGARAGNGVIVITTKRGKYNQPVQVNATANLTISPKPNLATDRVWINSSDYIDVEMMLFDKGYYNADLANTKTYPIVSPVVQLLAKARAGTISQGDADAQINLLRNNDVRSQLSDYYYRTLINQQYSVNMSGGTQTSNFMMSAGYDKNLATLQGNDDHRVTFNTYGSYKPVKNLEIGGGINYTQSQASSNSTLNGVQFMGAKSLYPYAQLADANGNPLAINKYSQTLIDNAVSNGFMDWSYVPLKDRGLNDNTSTLNDIRLQAQVKYTIIRGLSVQGNYQYENGGTKTNIYHSDSSYFTRDIINRYSTVVGGKVSVRNIPEGGILDQTDNSFTSKTGRLQMNFDRNFGKHSVIALGGVEAREVLGNSLASPTLYGYGVNNTDNYQAVDFLNPVKMFPSGAGVIPNLFNIYHTYNRYRSIYGNASYTYNNLYTLQGSIRSDKANLFGVNANKKGVPLWSTGGVWNLSGEHFYHLAWLPVLKIRATYGYSGNLPVGGSAYNTAAFLSGNTNLTPIRAGLIAPGNLDLTWEKDAQTNFALDFGLKNSVLTGSIEYFQKKGTDLVGIVPVAPSLGFSRATINYADMTGHGIDVQLNSINIRSSLFQWTSFFSISYATNKITNYNTQFGANVNSYQVVVGKPLEGLYAYKWAGLDPLNGDPRGMDSTGHISKAYSSLTNYPVSKQRYIGSQIPLFFGNLRNTFTYKSLSLSFNITGQFDYYFKRPTISYSGLFSSGAADKDYYARWQYAGDEAHTSVPSMPTTLPVDGARDVFYGGSEAVVTKGDHIRLQDLLLTYSIPKKVSDKLSMKSLHASLYINNINWILWRANQFGIDPNQAVGYKTPASFALSLQAGF